MTQLSPPTARKVTNRWPWISGLGAIALTVALGLIIALREAPFSLDTEWMEEIVEHRSPLWEVPAFIMDYIGGHWIAVFLIPIGGAVLLYFVRGKWTAIYYLGAAAISGAVVQLLKVTFGRARPEDFLFVIESGSFPSGHTANAATLAVTLALVIGRWWPWAVGALYTVVMALSRTYLGVHWVSDTVGGALVGIGVAFVLWAPFASRLSKEWIAKHPSEARQQTAAAPPSPEKDAEEAEQRAESAPR